MLYSYFSILHTLKRNLENILLLVIHTHGTYIFIISRTYRPEKYFEHMITTPPPFSNPKQVVGWQFYYQYKFIKILTNECFQVNMCNIYQLFISFLSSTTARFKKHKPQHTSSSQRNGLILNLSYTPEK